MNCTFILRILLSCFYLLFYWHSTAQTRSSRPNIVLIVADDHGREALGCYGNKAIKTPNIDRLAEEGIRFTNAFCTVASCSPSRAVLLSGLQSHTNGMYGLEHQQHHFRSFDSIKSLSVLMQQAGYRTARIGKFHVAPEAVFHFEKILQEGGVNNPGSIGRSPVEMADACRSFISETSEQPFFLYYASDDPHRSNTVLPDGTPSFNGSQPNRFGNKEEGYPGIKKTVFKPEDVVVPSYLPDNSATRGELAEYYQAINRLDQGVGRLMEHLKASGKYHETIIIYLSDNGAPFPGSKTTLYEPGMHLPLIIKPASPGKSNFVQDAFISWVDITPTLLDLAGVNGGRQFHGRSFKNILEQENVTGWDEVYASHSLHEITMYYPIRVLRERRYKLLYNIAHDLPFPQALDLYHSYTWQHIRRDSSVRLGKRSIKAYIHRPRFELYDLQKDPDELHNLAGESKYRHELLRMQQKLRQWQKNTKDIWQSKWEFE